MTAQRVLALVGRALLLSGIALAVAGNLIGLYTVVIDHQRAYDWDIYVEAARRFPLGTLYDWREPYFYRYAPQMAPVFGVISVIGLGAWRAAHFLALAVLPSRRLGLLLLVSYPFWFELWSGNIVTFVLLAGAWAYRGNRFATGAYLALCLLVPRPIMLPLMAWILWHRPEWRLPFAGMVILALLTALPTGYLPTWIGSLFVSGANEMKNDFNVSPSQLLGAWWLFIGVPLAVWLTLRGRLGWASMAISPYLLPYYVQMLGLELVRPPTDEAAVPQAGRIRRYVANLATRRSARSIE